MLKLEISQMKILVVSIKLYITWIGQRSPIVPILKLRTIVFRICSYRSMKSISPSLKKKLNPNFSKIEPWFTKGLLISRQTKLKLSKTASHNPIAENISAFKTYRNLYNRTVRAGKNCTIKTNLHLTSLISKEPGN